METIRAVFEPVARRGMLIWESFIYLFIFLNLLKSIKILNFENLEGHDRNLLSIDSSLCQYVDYSGSSQKCCSQNFRLYPVYRYSGPKFS